MNPFRKADLKPMRMHRPIAEKVILALKETFVDGYYVDKVLERSFKSDKRLGARDRKFVAESTYDIVRWWRLLWVALGHDDKPSLETKDLWRVLGAWLVLKGGASTLPQWTEFEGLDPARVLRRAERGAENPAVRESLPDWLFELGQKELGETWDRILTELNREAPVVLRANRLKTDRDSLKSVLAEEGIETTAEAPLPDGLKLKERKNVFVTTAFKSGLFEVQDGASQQVAPLLNPQPGERVVDACAGAGGKTLHLAALMKNKGKIIAMDVHEKKLEELRKRASRNGVDIVEVKAIESSKTIKRMFQSCDRLLLDVPCSGLGVLRRNPDSKWKLSMSEIERLHTLQAEILETYSEMVKPGGSLVYATCSILPSENGAQVASFLNKPKGREWKLVDEKSFWPGENGYDGFYAARLTKSRATDPNPVA